MTLEDIRADKPPGHTIAALRAYLSTAFVGNLIWEFAQMPLYTLWVTGTVREIAFAALHCTGGDMLIAAAALGAAWLLDGRRRWPVHGTVPVAVLTVGLGLAYTIFSEWLNTGIRQSWAYAPAMPVLPGLGTGLSPVLQWLVVPGLALRRAWQAGARRS